MELGSVWFSLFVSVLLSTVELAHVVEPAAVNLSSTFLK